MQYDRIDGIHSCTEGPVIDAARMASCAKNEPAELNSGDSHESLWQEVEPPHIRRRPCPPPYSAARSKQRIGTTAWGSRFLRCILPKRSPCASSSLLAAATLGRLQRRAQIPAPLETKRLIAFLASTSQASLPPNTPPTLSLGPWTKKRRFLQQKPHPTTGPGAPQYLQSRV